ncbi:hypothetical protein ACOZ4I_16475 [Haloarcula salina]|uniref:hypothetical protein n=1 Tax=Haloarcula salina TaxID=1429914 RepID=UPI003C7060B9
MRTKLFALYAAVGLIALAAGPGLVAGADSAGNTAGNALAVGVTQADDGSATVSVTANDTGVANASVAVETVDNASYAGTGDYTTDENGTVGLPAPEQNVTVEVNATADNRTAVTTADLTVAPTNATNETEFANFGLEVSAFVADLLGDENRTGGIGPAVASFVTANNPGNAPDHAGPPAHVTGENESENATHPSDRRGPPADIFGDDGDNETDDKRRGPPEDRGPNAADDETEDENETHPSERRGPPEDRGPDGETDEETETETETEAEDDDASDDRGNDGSGSENGNSGGNGGGNGNTGGNGNGPPSDRGN